MILVTLTSRNDSDFERSNISLKENKPDGVDLNSNSLYRTKEKLYGFRQNEYSVIFLIFDLVLSVGLC